VPRKRPWSDEVRELERARQRRWYKENPDKARAQHERYSDRHPGLLAERARAFRATHPDVIQARNSAFSRTKPNQKAANNALNNAIRKGEIVRPDACESCGRECRPHGHHPDYAKPLEVRWLCPSCHKRAHLEEVA
jgi:hypothetical protein